MLHVVFALIVLQGYVQYLTGSEEIRDRLSKDDLQHLFGNITTIYVFNRFVWSTHSRSKHCSFTCTILLPSLEST